MLGGALLLGCSSLLFMASLLTIVQVLEPSDEHGRSQNLIDDLDQAIAATTELSQANLSSDSVALLLQDVFQEASADRLLWQLLFPRASAAPAAPASAPSAPPAPSAPSPAPSVAPAAPAAPAALPWHELRRLARRVDSVLGRSPGASLRYGLPPEGLHGDDEMAAYLRGLHRATSALGVRLGELQASLHTASPTASAALAAEPIAATADALEAASDALRGAASAIRQRGAPQGSSASTSTTTSSGPTAAPRLRPPQGWRLLRGAVAA